MSAIGPCLVFFSHGCRPWALASGPNTCGTPVGKFATISTGLDEIGRFSNAGPSPGECMVLDVVVLSPRLPLAGGWLPNNMKHPPAAITLRN